MMRRALLSLAVLATTTTTTRAALRRALASASAEGSPRDEYVRSWAHEGKSRCGAPNCRWMRAFGPIDVGCRIEIDRVGLADGGARPIPQQAPIAADRDVAAHLWGATSSEAEDGQVIFSIIYHHKHTVRACVQGSALGASGL